MDKAVTTNTAVYTNRPNGWSRQVVRWLVRHGVFEPRSPSVTLVPKGKRYPHSSARQQARYARQEAIRHG